MKKREEDHERQNNAAPPSDLRRSRRIAEWSVSSRPQTGRIMNAKDEWSTGERTLATGRQRSISAVRLVLMACHRYPFGAIVAGVRVDPGGVAFLASRAIRRRLPGAWVGHRHAGACLALAVAGIGVAIWEAPCFDVGPGGGGLSTGASPWPRGAHLFRRQNQRSECEYPPRRSRALPWNRRPRRGGA